MSTPLPCQRVLIKLSGEALMGDRGFGLDPKTVAAVSRRIQAAHAAGLDICLVIGGGNIFRGITGAAEGMERVTADHMGMLATVMNALAVQSSLEALGCETRVMSAIPMDPICEPYLRRRAMRHLEKRRIVIFAAGSGNPFFTTDTAAALRASEMNCGAMIKATKVDGVYSADPTKCPDAVHYPHMTYDDVLSRRLGVMDATAVALARDSAIPIIVCSMIAESAFASALTGKARRTIIGDFL